MNHIEEAQHYLAEAGKRIAQDKAHGDCGSVEGHAAAAIAHGLLAIAEALQPHAAGFTSVEQVRDRHSAYDAAIQDAR